MLITLAVIFGFYTSNRLEVVIKEALALGEEQKGFIQNHFLAEGRIPQTAAEAGLEGALLQAL